MKMETETNLRVVISQWHTKKISFGIARETAKHLGINSLRNTQGTDEKKTLT